MPPAPNVDNRLLPALAASRYLQRELTARGWLAPLLAETIDTPLRDEAITAFLEREAADEQCLKSGLRRLRSWVLCHTMVRDLLDLAPLTEVTGAMSMLADRTLRHAHDLLYRTLAERHGPPTDAAGRPMPMTIIGMGKLGGYELNVSSDIDLIFLYPQDGETHGERPVEHLEFFTRLGGRLIGALSEATEDGFVFRVDMRLRPFGDSGPLACSYQALERYFITQGREWERFAWIKARPVSGVELDELAGIVRPFVFRKYLDFGAINALRDLHAHIRVQVVRQDRAMNIKLGPGGIREIEFIAQVFQIIRGGREPRLQGRRTLGILELLADLGLLEAATVRALSEAYVFLRRLEHRLQYLDDAQTHDIPGTPEDLQRIAAATGCAGQDDLLERLEAHRRAVTDCFQNVFYTPGDDSHTLDDLWAVGTPPEDIAVKLDALGFGEPEDSARRLTELRRAGSYRNLSEPIRRRFDFLVPRIIESCARQAEPDGVLHRTCNLLETISRRGAYLALLQQYPQALRRVVELLAASRWAAAYLTTHPILLDELLDSRSLEDVTDWRQFAGLLREQLDEAEPDTERQMDIMREQHHAQVFRLLIQDLAGRWEVEEIGDHLSALTDLMLAETIRQCWRKYRKRHRRTPRFAVIAYGKLGGKELGYGSDLDIAFLYDDDHPDAAEHYTRLAQRMLSWMSTRTSTGILFETDTRLRPSGRSGLLVSEIEAFFTYQRESAWLWEHQALTRARFTAGEAAVGEAFERGREALLGLPRDLADLADGIVAMRRRMLDSHPARAGLFHVKDDPGGLIDFEFIVQYLVLGYSSHHPRLLANLGNIALSRIAAELGLVNPARAGRAADAYRTLRRLQHRQRLNDEKGWIDGGAARNEREAVTTLWLEVFKRPIGP